MRPDAGDMHRPAPPPASAPGAALALVGRVVELLRSDGRLAGALVGRSHPLLALVRARGHLVVLAPAAVWDHGPALLRPYLEELSHGQAVGVSVGVPTRRALDESLPLGLGATVPAAPSVDELFVAVHNALELVDARQRSESRGKWLNRYRYELGELVEIARALTTERDIDKLLALILEKSRFVTGADAGSIYVVEGDDPDVSRRTLRFKLSQNDSVRFDSSEFTMPVSPRTMAGYVALKRTVLNIADVYEIPSEAPYSFGKSYDEASGYRTRSMFCAPLLSNQGQVLGVIQLINRKREPTTKLLGPADFQSQVVAFDERSEELVCSLAAQAGIALENAILYAENQRMLEGFVRASVEAIEQRDPTTSGHSRRVAEMTVGLARAVERCDSGPYRDVTWTDDDLRELEYASVLHDFGKIGVREEVLVKAKKLYPMQLEVVMQRFALASRSLELELLERKLEAIRRGSSEAELAAIDDELGRRGADLEAARAAILTANEPLVLRGGDFARIESISRETFLGPSGAPERLLTDDEVVALCIPRGSLTPSEFDEIRSHVRHTFEFLSQIPWGRKLRRVAQIAGAHHERLDGTGYPDRLHGTEIPLQSKLMAVSDIFDALTAADRPYKKAVPLGRAIDILRMEVNDGHVDGEIVRLFVDARVWQLLPDPPRD